MGAVGLVVEYRTRNREVAGSTLIRPTLSQLLSYCVLSLSGQLSLLPLAGREISSSFLIVGYEVKA